MFSSHRGSISLKYLTTNITITNFSSNTTLIIWTPENKQTKGRAQESNIKRESSREEHNKKLNRGRLEEPCPVGACCCLNIVAVALLWLCWGCCNCWCWLLSLRVYVQTCVRVYVRTCGRAYSVYRLTCEFVVAVVVAVENSRACLYNV